MQHTICIGTDTSLYGKLLTLGRREEDSERHVAQSLKRIAWTCPLNEGQHMFKNCDWKWLSTRRKIFGGHVGCVQGRL